MRKNRPFVGPPALILRNIAVTNRFHPDDEVDRLFRQLQSALCSWERSTSRDSLMIFRESDRNIAEYGPQPSAICLRWDNGIPLDPANADLDDAHLLQRFTDSIRNPPEVQREPKQEDKESGARREFVSDPERYRRASVPHESPAKAQGALDAFCDELSALRLKYRIRDLYAICNVGVVESDGSETTMHGTTGFGSQSLWASMTAYAFGKEKALQEKKLRDLVAAGESGL